MKNSNTKQKKVVIQVVQHLLPGGLEIMCLDLQKFSPRDHEVHIVSLEGSAEEMAKRWPRLLSTDASLHFMGKKEGREPLLLIKLARLFKKLKASVVQTHHIGPLLYGGLAAKMAGIKTIVHTEHDAWHLENASDKAISEFCFKWVKPILVADADIVAQNITSAIPTATPKIVHNGIDTRHFSPGNKAQSRQDLGLPRNVTIVGCAARMHAVKGHEVLLDALFRLPKEVHLALAGTGPTEQLLKKQVIELSLQDRVHFLGQVEDMPAFYRAIDVFCLASYEEGMPLSPLEAQSCGTRAIVTDVGGCKETLCPKSGTLIDARNSKALSNAINKVISTIPLASPRDFIVERRDVTHMVDAYQKLMFAVS
ncbi:glycosyltransferase [Alkalimarinus sediminis]|uniref:Glycosyltransferase n=1 Tax=Alkalimarinus sediminis TaxID=1632866 RepID=A0A9E8HN40_9ALTE|nr:glycosyltransferase [Alkalimarinus sediminis]UZW75976.1 glycosyltransferase [Alkalimarinus sediminis]